MERGPIGIVTEGYIDLTCCLPLKLPNYWQSIYFVITDTEDSMSRATFSLLEHVITRP